MSKEAVCCTDDLINTILDLKPLPAMRPMNLFPEDVYITPLSTRISPSNVRDLPEAYGPFETSLKVQKYGVRTENDALHLKQFLLSLKGIAYDW